MNEDLPSFDGSELSADDLAVLRAFEEMEEFNITSSSSVWSEPSSAKPDSNDDATDDMLLLFISEVKEDIERMQRVLYQLEKDDHIHSDRFVPLHRSAHKIRGTAGAVECHALASIAHYIELLIDQITQGIIFPIIGVSALQHAILALETTLEGIISEGKEENQPLLELEAEFNNLGLDLQEAEEPAASPVLNSDADISATKDSSSLDTTTLLENIPALPSPSSIPLIRVDTRRVDQLILQSERLTEQRMSLENAEAQVTNALQELHTAQTRLQQLEPALSSILSTSTSPHQGDQQPTSSLIARILHTATQRSDAHPLHKVKSRARLVKAAGSSTWDELDMERYNEKDMLIRTLREAIADVSVASSRVRVAFTQLHQLLQDYIVQAATVRNDILQLRLTPLSILVPRLRQAITTSELAQEQKVLFEVVGEATEVDQDILEALTYPLLQLLRTCVTDTSNSEVMEQKEPYRVWLHARGIDNELVLEIGFSMTVSGGAVEIIREPIQRLNGMISLQRNASGGLSFHLRLPRSHSTAHCLLVRVGHEQIIVPFAQVQRVSDGQREALDMLYNLNELLGFPAELPISATRVQPVLIIPRNISRRVIGVAVDEVIGETELVVKPLSPYLQRPGVARAAVDGKGNVLLMVDLPALISHYTSLQRDTRPALPAIQSDRADDLTSHTQQPRILVADDSVYLRHSLLQTLEHANYKVTEAREGMEALEQLLENVPDIFLLDIEMPNLNGYDVLSIMRLYPELSEVKVIMLTSRSSEKHIQRARELGAHAYLTKPCPHELLLEKIQELLLH